MTASPMAGQPDRLAALPSDISASPPDIGALRLRELAARFSGGEIRSDTGSDSTLEQTDTEFEPVTLATILELGRTRAIESHAEAPAVTASATTVASLPPPSANALPLVVESTHEVAGPPAPRLISLAPPIVPEPIAATSEPTPADLPQAEIALGPVVESDATEAASVAVDQPLMLADQSAPELRLVDLIRRQQSLLEQLNRFPPPYPQDAEANAPPDPSPPDVPQLSVIAQLAPPPAPNFDDSPSEREPTPPLQQVTTLAPPPLPRSRAVRENKDETGEAELPEQSPKIILRARAEQSGRHTGRGVAAPPSVAPAFFAGLAAALVIAGALFVIL